MLNKCVSMTLSVAGSASRFISQGSKGASVVARAGDQIVKQEIKLIQ